MAMIMVNARVTTMFKSMVQLRMLGGNPRNRVAKILESTNIKRPRLIYT